MDQITYVQLYMYIYSFNPLHILYNPPDDLFLEEIDKYTVY